MFEPAKPAARLHEGSLVLEDNRVSDQRDFSGTNSRIPSTQDDLAHAAATPDYFNLEESDLSESELEEKQPHQLYHIPLGQLDLLVVRQQLLLHQVPLSTVIPILRALQSYNCTLPDQFPKFKLLHGTVGTRWVYPASSLGELGLPSVPASANPGPSLSQPPLSKFGDERAKTDGAPRAVIMDRHEWSRPGTVAATRRFIDGLGPNGTGSSRAVIGKRRTYYLANRASNPTISLAAKEKCPVAGSMNQFIKRRRPSGASSEFGASGVTPLKTVEVKVNTADSNKDTAPWQPLGWPRRFWRDEPAVPVHRYPRKARAGFCATWCCIGDSEGV